jgi:hypothetical protein
MNYEHVISEELWDEAQIEFSKSRYWIAYNTIPYFLDKGEMNFFKTVDEAREFADNNISEFDNYSVIYARSADELLKQIDYGYALEQQLLTTNKLSIMNEKNYDYLSNQLKYTGFGEDLQVQLNEKMQKQEPEFMLQFKKDFGKDQTVATLHFRKSNENDMYFFNRYALMLKNDQHPDPISHTFFITNKDTNITLKEAYNLMSGRAIHKEVTPREGEKFNAWLQLDFKETDLKGNYKMKMYHENYKFDLKSVLEKHPIKEMNNETDSKRLIESLERGNRQQVTLNIHGKEQKLFIEAVPKFKSLNFYEASGQRIRSDKLYESNGQDQVVKQNRKQQHLKQDSEDEGGFEAPKKSRRKRQNIS